MSKECDAYIHIDTFKLQHELRAALKEDESRKKTDEMKKRAMHTAKSYDEFQHMVSCAQLIPVTRKEMEMLSDTKRGWQGRSRILHSTNRAKSGGKSQQNNISSRRRPTALIPGESKGSRLRAPRSYAQFQRIWRQRCHNDDERRYYMRLIGHGSLPTLFRLEMEPHVLAQMLSIVCNDSRIQLEGLDNRVVASSLFAGKAPATGSAPTSTDENKNCYDLDMSSKQAAIRCLEWLDALSRTGRFKFNIKFLRQAEKSELINVFGLIAATFAENFDEKLSAVNLMRNAYDLSYSV